MIGHLGVEAVHVQSAGLRILHQGRRREVMDLDKQQVVHRPEPALCSRRFGRLCCKFRVRMDLHQGKVPEHETQTARVGGDEVLHQRLGVDASRALVVSVLEQRELRLRVAQNMIGCRQSRLGNPDDRSVTHVAAAFEGGLKADLGNGCQRLGQRALALGGQGDILEPGFVDARHDGVQRERDPVDDKGFALRRQADAGLRVDYCWWQTRPMSQAKENAIVKQAACAAARISSGFVSRRSSSNRLAKP